jgi:hypothetical protein
MNTLFSRVYRLLTNVLCHRTTPGTSSSVAQEPGSTSVSMHSFSLHFGPTGANITRPGGFSALFAVGMIGTTYGTYQLIKVCSNPSFLPQ